jgi:hypothetical protein
VLRYCYFTTESGKVNWENSSFRLEQTPTKNRNICRPNFVSTLPPKGGTSRYHILGGARAPPAQSGDTAAPPCWYCFRPEPYKNAQSAPHSSISLPPLDLLTALLSSSVAAAVHRITCRIPNRRRLRTRQQGESRVVAGTRLLRSRASPDTERIWGRKLSLPPPTLPKRRSSSSIWAQGRPGRRS